jgi:hypothetical protein
MSAAAARAMDLDRRLCGMPDEDDWGTYSTPKHRTVTEEDHRQTRRDLRVAIIFGFVAASIELGVLIYFFR